MAALDKLLAHHLHRKHQPNWINAFLEQTNLARRTSTFPSDLGLMVKLSPGMLLSVYPTLQMAPIRWVAILALRMHQFPPEPRVIWA